MTLFAWQFRGLRLVGSGPDDLTVVWAFGALDEFN